MYELDIKVGPFDHKEYDEAKTSLIEEMSCGEDGIPPEVLKRYDLDSMILDLCTVLFYMDRNQISGPFSTSCL